MPAAEEALLLAGDSDEDEGGGEFESGKNASALEAYRNAAGIIVGAGSFAVGVHHIGGAGVVRGYLNLCPHFSLKLNQRGEQFLNDDGSLIRCTQHFAEFRIADGFCVAGACEGSFLDPVPVHVADGHLVIGPDPACPDAG